MEITFEQDYLRELFYEGRAKYRNIASSLRLYGSTSKP